MKIRSDYKRIAASVVLERDEERECAINKLNDDCLREIFICLSVNDKLRIERGIDL